MAKDCALLTLAAASLRGADARSEYRESLAEYRQDTLTAVRDYYLDQLAAAGTSDGSMSALPTAEGSSESLAVSAHTEVSHLGLLVQLVEARCELALLRNESALNEMEREMSAAAVLEASSPRPPPGRGESALGLSREKSTAGPPKKGAGTPPSARPAVKSKGSPPRADRAAPEVAWAGAARAQWRSQERRPQLTTTPPRGSGGAGSGRMATPPRVLRAATPPRG